MIEKNNKKLDEFEYQVGLPPNILNNHDEFKNYLNMDITQLEKLTTEQCAYIGFRLVQFSLYIQRGINREKAKIRLLIKNIDKIIAPKISQYPGNWGMQRENAVLDNDAAQELDQELLLSEQKQDRLEFIATNIKSLAEHLKNIQFAKREKS